MIDIKYFKEYRLKLGFSNQGDVKSFFCAKDIFPQIDYNYVLELNKRLFDIIIKINSVVVDDLKWNNLNDFYNKNVQLVFEQLRANEILQKLNNQGRRREEVYFSWMRGFVIAAYFTKAIAKLFHIDENSVSLIGDDDLNNIENFKRTPKADLELLLSDNKKIRVEVQSGFQGINDIKQHKVLEAKRIKQEEDISLIVVHFDLFNGQVALVKIDEIEDDSINWITRQQMEGQTVFNIDQNYFIWKLTEGIPSLDDLQSFV